MSCPHPTASTVSAAICLRASGCRWVAVREDAASTPRLPFQPMTRLWEFEGLSVKHGPSFGPVPCEGGGHTFESRRARRFGIRYWRQSPPILRLGPRSESASQEQIACRIRAVDMQALW
jgi:hypothetical protein